MIITLTGENDFGRTGELKALVDEFVAEHGELALERIDGEETEFARISEALISLPFLASRKLVVFKNPSANKEFVEGYENLLKNLPETTDLILVEAKLDKRTSLYKNLKKTSDWREFSRLDASSLTNWLIKEAAASGREISTSDARFLVQRAGENQQKLANELDKLLAYNSKITKKSIEELVEPTPQSKIFDLLDAAFSGNTQVALKIYSEQRQMKVEPQAIIAMLAWELHLLALSKAAEGKLPTEIASEARVSPYSIKNASMLARKLNLTQIKKYVGELLALDEEIKSTGLDADEALKTYLQTLVFG